MSKTRSRRPRNDLFECVVGIVPPAERPQRSSPPTRPWFHFTWLGVDWSVELADKDALAILADDVDADGITLPYEGRVIVWENVEPTLRAHILMHELMHVAFNGHAGSDSLALALGVPTKRAHRAEEKIVGFVAPLLYGVLVAAGMLTTPEPKPARKPRRGRR